MRGKATLIKYQITNSQILVPQHSNVSNYGFSIGDFFVAVIKKFPAVWVCQNCNLCTIMTEIKILRYTTRELWFLDNFGIEIEKSAA